MLADSSDIPPHSGAFRSDLHLPACSRFELLDFIADQLPNWRDRADRRPETAETILTSQLCAHLNSAARHADGWDILQFRIEEPDEQERGRKIDLAVAPCGVTIWIDGRGYSDFDALVPIECKRLPTPKGKDRDEREYVFSRYSTTGGMQRFKAGHHGSAHRLGAMIAYVQDETAADWDRRIAGWIGDLVKSGSAGWSVADLLEVVSDDRSLRLTILRSAHERSVGGDKLELRHLWLEMNSA